MRRTALLSILAGGLLWAQMPGPRPGGPIAGMGDRVAASYDELKAALGLSDAQINQLRQLQLSAAQANRNVLEQLAERARTLRDAMKTENDPAVLGRILIDIRNLRKQLTDAETRTRDQALQILTADQRTKLRTLEDALKLQPAIQQAVMLHLMARPQVEGLGMWLGGGVPRLGMRGPEGNGRFGRR